MMNGSHLIAPAQPVYCIQVCLLVCIDYEKWSQRLRPGPCMSGGVLRSPQAIVMHAALVLQRLVLSQ